MSRNPLLSKVGQGLLVTQARTLSSILYFNLMRVCSSLGLREAYNQMDDKWEFIKRDEISQRGMLWETRDCNASLRVRESSREGWRDGGKVWVEELGLPYTPRKIWQGHQGFMKPRSASSQRSSVSPRNRLILVTLPCGNCGLSTNAGLDFRVLGPNSWTSSALCSWTSTTELCF